MEAPDKIYMNPVELDERAKYLLEPFKDRDICYIRKDHLVEWAENNKKLRTDDEFVYAMDVLINWLNK